MKVFDSAAIPCAVTTCSEPLLLVQVYQHSLPHHAQGRESWMAAQHKTEDQSSFLVRASLHMR